MLQIRYNKCIQLGRSMIKNLTLKFVCFYSRLVIFQYLLPCIIKSCKYSKKAKQHALDIVTKRKIKIYKACKHKYYKFKMQGVANRHTKISTHYKYKFYNDNNSLRGRICKSYFKAFTTKIAVKSIKIF